MMHSVTISDIGGLLKEADPLSGGINSKALVTLK